MPTAYLKVTDERGNALNGVILTSGEYNTTPCPFGSNCTTGRGNSIEGTTSNSGVIAFPIPFTCVGEWSGVLKADGYEDYPWDVKTGYISGDVNNPIGSDKGWTIQMVESSLGGGAPENQGGNAKAGDLTNQTTATTEGASNNTKKAASNLSGWLTQEGGWIVVLLLVVVVIGVAYAIHTSKGGTTEKTTNFNTKAVVA